MNSHFDNSAVYRNSRPAAFGLIATVAVLAMGIADVSAARGGGGARAGGGGGRMAHSSVSGASHSMSRPNTRGASAGNRASTGNVNAGNRANTGNVNAGNRANTGNVNTGNRVNTGNINTGNVNIGNDVNIDIDGGYGYHGGYYHGGGYYHPVAAGVAIGAVAVTTAAVLGSYYYALPPSCTVVVKSGVSYHYCGSVYYQQTWSGNDPVYVVVNP
jgi:hypothetical protein